MFLFTAGSPENYLDRSPKLNEPLDAMQNVRLALWLLEVIDITIAILLQN